MKDVKRKIDKVNNIGDFLKIWFDHQLIDGDYTKVFNDYYASFKNNFSRRIKFIRHYRVFPNHRFFESFQKIESSTIFNKLTFMYMNYNYIGEKI
tara:strand:+ start:284 stop:568 length:285 start_codon:yes stop_codon:yes gene_type:complete